MPRLGRAHCSAGWLDGVRIHRLVDRRQTVEHGTCLVGESGIGTDARGYHHQMSEQPKQGGVGSRSSLADIKDALSRLGTELETVKCSDRWVATLTVGGVTGSGETEQAAAYDLWTRYVTNQGGTGTS